MVRRSVGLGAVAVLLACVMAVAAPLDALASSSYASAVAALSPTAYIPLDEGSGTVSGDLVSPISATLDSSAMWSASSGMVTGSSYSVVGNGSRVVALNTAVHSGPGTSYTVWLRTTNTGSAEAIITNQGPTMNSCRRRLDLSIQPSSSLNVDDLYCDVAETSTGCTPAGAALTNGNAHMVAVTDDGTNIKLYFDGTLCTTGTATSATWSGASHDTTIGGFPASLTSSFRFGSNTKIGQAAWFSSVLSSTQVSGLYAARTPTPSKLYVTPDQLTIVGGHSALMSFQSTDAFGNDSTSFDTFTFAGTSPSGGMTCPTITGASAVCTAGSTRGTYTATWHSSAGSLTATTKVYVVGQATRFIVFPVTTSIVAGGTVTYVNYSSDGHTETSPNDAWDFSDVPSGVTCGQSVFTAADIEHVCTSDTPGTYTLTASDQAGIFATVTLTVAAAPAASAASCHSGDLVSDTVCWLSNTFNALANLPGAILNGLYGLFFVSRTGVSYINVDTLTSSIIPTVGCRSGQAPTAPDATNCLPFPFSVPGDLWDIVNVANVTPVAPTWTVHFHVMGSSHSDFTLDPSVILDDDMMSYIRGAELLLLIVGTAFGTWKWVEMTGVAG